MGVLSETHLLRAGHPQEKNVHFLLRTRTPTPYYYYYCIVGGQSGHGFQLHCIALHCFVFFCPTDGYISKAQARYIAEALFRYLL